MLPELIYTPIVANGEVFRQIQHILDKNDATVPANITAQLMFAAIIELGRRVDSMVTEQHQNAKSTLDWREAIEERIDSLDAIMRANIQIEAEKDKSRITLRDIMERLVEPVVVAVITAIVVGAIVVWLHP